MDFIIGPFPIIKKTQCVFAKKSTSEIREIPLGSFWFSFRNISEDNSVQADNAPVFMFSSKVWFIVI